MSFSSEQRQRLAPLRQRMLAHDAEETSVVEPDGTKYVAHLRALEEFRGQARLVPDGLLALIDAREIAT